ARLENHLQIFRKFALESGQPTARSPIGVPEGADQPLDEVQLVLSVWNREVQRVEAPCWTIFPHPIQERALSDTPRRQEEQVRGFEQVPGSLNDLLAIKERHPLR